MGNYSFGAAFITGFERTRVRSGLMQGPDGWPQIEHDLVFCPTPF